MSQKQSTNATEAVTWNPRKWSKEVLSALPWNDYQMRVFEALEESDENLVISATAGSGKCVHPSTLVAVNGCLLSASKIWEDNHTDEVFDGEGYVSLPSQPLYVDSFDESKLEFVRKPIVGLYRQRLKEPLRRIDLSDGSSITITKQHKLHDGFNWTNQFQVGDTVAVPNRLPTEVYAADPDIAVFLGWFLAEGYTDKSPKGHTVAFSITQKDRKVLDELLEIIVRIENKYKLDVSPKRLTYRQKNDTWALNWSSREFAGFLKGLGTDLFSLSNGKSVPWYIMKSHNDSIKLFLRAFFDGEGHVQSKRRSIELTSASKLMITQISYLLRRVGVWSFIAPKMACATNGTKIMRQYYRMTIGSISLRAFAEQVGFTTDYKIANLNKAIDAKCNPNKELLPANVIFRELQQATGLLPTIYGMSGNEYLSTKKASRRTAEKGYQGLNEIKLGQHIQGNQWRSDVIVDVEVKESIDHAASQLRKLIDQPLEYPTITKIEEFLYEGEVYDFQVADTQNFVAENILCHNSTLLKGIIGLLPTNAKINVMMYNVTIKDAFEKDPRIPKRVTVSTAHGCGYGLLIGYFRGDAPSVDDDKARKLSEWGLKRLREAIADKSRYHPIAPPVLPDEREKAELWLEKWQEALRQLIDFARLNLAESDVESLEYVAGYFGIRFPFGKRGTAWGIKLAIDLLEDCYRMGVYDRVIDYADMVWLPHKLKLYPRKPKAAKAYLLSDECQDSCRAFISLYKKFEIVGYRCIFVGDPFQSISGYMGALPSAMDTIIRLFNAKVLPLSESQRCPKTHVALASLISPDMKARADAIEGSCKLMHPDVVNKSVKPGDLVLCRFVAPLVKLFLEAKFFEGKQGVVRSRDIAKEMGGFAKQIGKNTKWSQFHHKLIEQKTYLIERHMAAQQLQQADAVSDRYQCLEYCYEFLGRNAGSLKEFVEAIDEAFPKEDEDRSRHVIYSSVHSAKGDESTDVYIIGTNVLPYYRQGMLAWMFQQEIYVTFVALTRSKANMYFVPMVKDPVELAELMQKPCGGLKMEYFEGFE